MSLTSNLSICCIVLLLLGSNFGFSSGRPSAGTELDIQEFVKHQSTEIEKTLKTLTDNARYVFQNVKAIVSNTLREGLINVLSEMDMATRMELLFMADGSHFIFPLAKADSEKEYKIVAVAVSKLLMNLKTMERADKLIKNSTRSMWNEYFQMYQHAEPKMSPKEEFETCLELYVKALNHQFETADREVAKEYKKERAEATEFVKRNPKMNGPLRKVWEFESTVSDGEMESFFEDKNVFYKSYLNKMFLKHAVKHLSMIFDKTEVAHYLMARALIQMVQASKHESEINDIYQRALDKKDKLCSEELFFNFIENRIEANPTLRSDVKAVMEQIEKNTVYDIDMLHVDFSII